MPRPHRPSSQTLVRQPRGFALGVAIIAIAVIGAIIAGALFASTQEFRLGRNALVEHRAMTAAEYGATWGFRKLNQNKQTNLTMATGATNPPDTVRTGDSSYAIVRLTRLNPNTYWIVSEGYAGGRNAQVQATRRINNVIRIAIPSFNPRGALTVRGGVTVQGSSQVNGNDSLPPQWKNQAVCPPPGAGMPGIAAPDTAAVCDGNCGSSPKGRIIGNPPKVSDPLTSDSLTYFKYGDQTWSSLVQHADVKLPGGNYKPAATVVNGQCDRSNTLNWGDVSRATVCADYFPIIYVDGDVKLASNASGQGILLVNGSVTLVGGFEFNGIVIARNDVNSAGNGNKVSGAVFAANTSIQDNSGMNGNSTIQYSSCAVTRATQGSAGVMRAKQRGWAELF